MSSDPHAKAASWRAVVCNHDDKTSPSMERCEEAESGVYMCENRVLSWWGWCLSLTGVQFEAVFHTGSSSQQGQQCCCCWSSSVHEDGGCAVDPWYLSGGWPECSSQPFCISGVTDYLSAEISTSKQKKFSLVTFVDTPGLVDGDMVYPFDANSAITWLGRSLQLEVSSKVGALLEHFFFVFLCRRAGRSDICVLWPYGPGPLQTYPQHSRDAEWEMWRQADVLPQQGRWSRQWNRQTSRSLQNPSVSVLEVEAKWSNAYVCLCRGWWCR